MDNQVKYNDLLVKRIINIMNWVCIFESENPEASAEIIDLLESFEASQFREKLFKRIRIDTDPRDNKYIYEYLMKSIDIPDDFKISLMEKILIDVDSDYKKIEKNNREIVKMILFHGITN